MEILCHPHESPNKVRILPNKVEILPNKATATREHGRASRTPKTFHRTLMSTKAVTEGKADLRGAAPISVRRPIRPEQFPAQ